MVWTHGHVAPATEYTQIPPAEVVAQADDGLQCLLQEGQGNGMKWLDLLTYPLVNIQKAIENGH